MSESSENNIFDNYLSDHYATVEKIDFKNDSDVQSLLEDKCNFGSRLWIRKLSVLSTIQEIHKCDRCGYLNPRDCFMRKNFQFV
jgi:hypothetical protein